MSLSELDFENGSGLREQKDSKDRVKDDTKLLVSLHEIEFSKEKDGYLEVATDIFFSRLLHLLYVRNVEAGKDFETAKEKAKTVLISQLEKKKQTLLTKSIFQSDNAKDYGIRGKRLFLLNKAISILEAYNGEQLYYNY